MNKISPKRVKLRQVEISIQMSVNRECKQKKIKKDQQQNYLDAIEGTVLKKLLGGRHKEGRSRGISHDPTSLKNQKEEGLIAVDVVLNIGI